MVLRIISAIAFGAVIGGIVGAVATGDPRYTLLWSLSLPVAILAGLWGLFAIGKRSAPTVSIDPAQLALARVERITRTGFSINDQPQCDLQLTVAPPRRPAYTTTHRQIVDVTALAQVSPGSIVVVRRPDDDWPDVQLVLEPPTEWAALRQAEQLRTGDERTVPLAAATPAWAPAPSRTPAAAASAAPGDTPAASAAPATPGAAAPARAPREREPRPRPVLVFAWWALVLVSAAAFAFPAYASIGRTVSALVSGGAGAGVVEGDRHGEVVDALEAETGGTQFVRIGFYDDYAIASAPSAPGALTIDVYQYRYDRTERQGPDTIQPQDPAAALFDASDVDFSQIPAFIATAKESSGIAEPDSVIVLVSRGATADEGVSPPVQMTVVLDSPYEDVTVVFDAATGEPVS